MIKHENIIMKVVVVVSLLIGIAGGIQVIGSGLASSKDLINLEERVVRTLDEFQKKTSLQFDVSMLEQMNLEMASYRRLMRQNPDDYVLVEEYEKLNRARDCIKKRLEEKLN